MGKNKKKTFLYVIGFLTHFLFLCYLHPLTLQAQTKKEEIRKYLLQSLSVSSYFRRYFRISLLPFNHMEYRTVDFLLHIS